MRPLKMARSAEHNPHVTVGTHQHAPTSGPKVVANDGQKCSFTHPGKVGDDRHQRSGNGSMSIKTGRSTSDEMCLERRPRIFFFQYDFLEENWMATNKDAIQTAILSKCGKTLPAQEKEKDLFMGLFSGDERMIAIRTPLLVRICINSGLSTVDSQSERRRVQSNQPS